MKLMVLDSDRLRTGLNRDLGFHADDRAENVSRVGEVAALLVDTRMIAIVALISLFREGRSVARLAPRDAFHEIYVEADRAVCEARDPKGLYRRARRGEIAEFTGISSPYEPPERAELVVDSAQLDAESAIELVAVHVKACVTLDSSQHS
ncbi:adenylyl-sulfate kinase [Paraburkholderia sp.]|uniref:adenylyl-sulfate kinase n=1 Tax=Paraburkholderia sp. TaxID=1926495 RepID=UPI003D6E2356